MHCRSASLIVTAIALAAPAVAPAQIPPGTASVRLDRACYTPGDTITATGTGFTPGAQVSEAVNLLAGTAQTPLGTLLEPVVTTASNGMFTRQVKAPNLVRVDDERERATSVFADAAKTASVPWTLSEWALNVPQWEGDGIANPRRTMTVEALGWTDLGPTLYAHYFHAGTRVKTVRIGRLTGDCRDLRKRVHQFPFKAVAAGRWAVYFSTTRRLDRENDAYFWMNLRVPK
jgi:hypothetical protein